MANEPAVYGLKYQARALCNVPADSDAHTFFVATQALLYDNEFYVLVYNEDDRRMFVQSIYTHKPEVWALASAPWRKSVFCSAYNLGSSGFHASLWRLPCMEDDASAGSTMKELTRLGGDPGETASIHEGSIKSLLFGPVGYRDSLVTVDDTTVHLWTVEDAGAHAIEKQTFQLGMQRLVTAVWDTQHTDRIVVGSEKAVDLLDIRTGKSTLSFQPHSLPLRCLDCNPNVPEQICTAGEDQRISIWDVRNTDKPIVSKISHSHWITSVSYNPFYDQLLLTASTDTLVQLWGIETISSAARPESTPQPPTLVARVDKHEDSVTAACWSAAGPWVFASLSYDGRVLLHNVPQGEKYKILLVE